MVRAIAIAIVAAAAGPAAAGAHVGVSPTSAPAGRPVVFEVSIPHGCDGSPTTGVALRLPDGVTEAIPLPEDGWSAVVAPGDDGALVATWSGGSIPDAEVGVFEIEMALPAAEPGTVVHVPAVQRCAEGEARWIQIPAEGEDPSSLTLPAPAIEILEPGAEPRGEAAGGRHDTASATGAAEPAATTATTGIETATADGAPTVGPAEAAAPAAGEPAGTGPSPVLLPLSVLALIGAGVGAFLLLRRRG